MHDKYRNEMRKKGDKGGKWAGDENKEENDVGNKTTL